MTLVYQAYGDAAIVRQNIFSIVSFLHNIGKDGDALVVVYTDQPETFRAFFAGEQRILAEAVTPAQLHKWRGTVDFLHRVKIEMLIDAARKYPFPMVYCDGDTCFTQSPMELFSTISDSTSLMHIAEGALDRGSSKSARRTLKFVLGNSFRLSDMTVTIPGSTVMWNAGVIGISNKNKSVLPFVLELTDALYGKLPKHVMEQLAFSFALQAISRIVPAHTVVRHYWNAKPSHQETLDRFLAGCPDVRRAVQACSQAVLPPSPEMKSW